MSVTGRSMFKDTCGPSRSCAWRRATQNSLAGSPTNAARFCIAITQAGDPCGQPAEIQATPWDHEWEGPNFIGQPFCRIHYAQLLKHFAAVVNGPLHHEVRAEPSIPEPDPPREIIKGFVYFARRGDQVKIGFTTTPQKRFAALQTQGGFVFDETIYAASDKRFETFYHWRFGDDRVIGEWFNVTSEITQVMADLEEDLKAMADEWLVSSHKVH
jgi:hypothetical protein